MKTRLDEDNTKSLDEDSTRCRDEVNIRSLMKTLQMP